MRSKRANLVDYERLEQVSGRSFVLEMYLPLSREFVVVADDAPVLPENHDALLLPELRPRGGAGAAGNRRSSSSSILVSELLETRQKQLKQQKAGVTHGWRANVSTYAETGGGGIYHAVVRPSRFILSKRNRYIQHVDQTENPEDSTLMTTFRSAAPTASAPKSHFQRRPKSKGSAEMSSGKESFLPNQRTGPGRKISNSALYLLRNVRMYSLLHTNDGELFCTPWMKRVRVFSCHTRSASTGHICGVAVLFISTSSGPESWVRGARGTPRPWPRHASRPDGADWEQAPPRAKSKDPPGRCLRSETDAYGTYLTSAFTDMVGCNG